MDTAQNDNQELELKKNKKYVIITRIVIILTILSEILAFNDALDYYYGKGGGYEFDIKSFLTANFFIVIILGVMWIFGIFKLKE